MSDAARAVVVAFGLVGGLALVVFAALAAWEFGGLLGLVLLALAAVAFWCWWMR